ncbi:MAG: S-adenosyl-l-methionine hydroxide adenosyltransferase family protein, partial [bacterium]
MASSIITLLTDFGYKDAFVGIMKGVILSLYPDANIVDISHEIEPQNISAGAFLINNSYKYFPSGTVHVIVIDPGVGSKRRILCVSAFDHFFLAPDNGVLKYIYKDCSNIQVIEVSNKVYFRSQISQTFHGRDIFAPVAAHLAKGIDASELGMVIDDYDRGTLPRLEEIPRGLRGEIIYIDQFGNLISNIPFNILKKLRNNSLKISLKNCTISGLVNAYAQGKRDEAIALIGSSGYLEIAINSGSAKNALSCAV